MSPQAAAKSMRMIGWFSLFVAVVFAWGSVFDPGGVNDLFLQHAATGETGIAGVSTQEAKLVMAIAGGVFGGLVGFYLFVSAPGIEQQNPMIRRGTILAFLIWFLIDSSASIGTGNATNAGLNVVVLAFYLWPVLLVKTPT